MFYLLVHEYYLQPGTRTRTDRDAIRNTPKRQTISDYSQSRFQSFRRIQVTHLFSSLTRSFASTAHFRQKSANLKSKNWIRAFLEYTQTGTNPKGFLSGHPRTERSPVRPTSTNQLHINMSIAFHGIPWLQDSSALKVPRPLQICFLSIMLACCRASPYVLYISCFSTNIPRTTPAWVPCFDPAMSRRSSATTHRQGGNKLFSMPSPMNLWKNSPYFVLFLAWNLIKLTSGERLSR